MIVDYDQLKLRPQDKRLRKNVGDLSGLVESLKLVGQIHDILVDENWFVRIGTRKYLALGIAEIKKVKIDKRDGLSEEEWTIMKAHENLKRKDLDPVEEALSLVKAKEAYEKMYPKTKKHAIGGVSKGVKAKLRNTSDKLSVEKKSFMIPKLPTSFTKNAAEKTGVSQRTIRRKVELGKAIHNGSLDNEAVQKLKSKEITPYKVMKDLKNQKSDLNYQLMKLCKQCAKADVRYCIYCNRKFIICRKSGNLPFKKIDAKACENFEKP